MKITRIETIPINVPLKEGLMTKTAHGQHVVSPYLIVRIHPLAQRETVTTRVSEKPLGLSGA